MDEECQFLHYCEQHHVEVIRKLFRFSNHWLKVRDSFMQHKGLLKSTATCRGVCTEVNVRPSVMAMQAIGQRHCNGAMRWKCSEQQG